MPWSGKERRKHPRYDTEVQIYFHVNYDLKTRVKYQIVEDDGKTPPKKYSAVSQNLSAEGMAFVSAKKLDKGDDLNIEVFLPGNKEPVLMNGTVRWSQALPSKADEKTKYTTGILLKTVNGQPIRDSIHHDETHHVIWSLVLESVFGSFRAFTEEQRKRKA